jgi:ADP-heptose:LPS heptosyltransferase
MGKPIFEQGVLKVVGKPLGRQVFKPRVSTQIGTSLTQLQQIVNTGQMRICIVRSLGGIGDVLMSTPLLRAIKYQWPNCHLTYATDFKYVNGGLKDILLYNPYIDELISHHSVAGREFDFKADITSCCIHAEKQIQRPPNRIDIFAEHVGVSLAETGHLPDYIVSTTEQQWAKEKLSRFPLRTQNTRRIGIQVRSSTLTRSWPLEKVRELAIKLAAHDDIQVCIFDSVHGQGPREEWNISRLVNLSDLSIRPTAALINEMDLFIAPDSGLLHVAGALNKRIVALFAGTDSNARINYYPNAVAIARNDWKCWPCWYSGEACNRQYTCIHSITVDEVYNAVMQLLVTPQVLRSVYIPEQSQTNKEINIIRAVGGLGDLICVSAVIHAYKVQHPDIAINLFVPEQYNDIFIGNPDITQLKSCQTPILSKYCCNLTDVDAKHEVAALK